MENIDIGISAEHCEAIALISDRMRIHEKTVWMLRAMLETA